MRKTTWLTGVILTVGMAAPAWAGSNGFFGSGVPLTFVPLQTTGSNVPIASPMTLNRPLTSRLDSMIPNFRGFSNKLLIGRSQFPTAAQMPGPEYLKAFKYSRGVP